MIRGFVTSMPSAYRNAVGIVAILCLCLSASALILAQETLPAGGAPTAETAAPTVAPAEPPGIEDVMGKLELNGLKDNLNALWTCIAAFLVFWMQAGFAYVETGLTRAKNTCNILMKNLMDFALGSIAYWVVGFGIMFGVSAAGGLYGTSKFFYEGTTNFDWAFFLFQTVFCATAATIVSGAMAERTKFQAYLLYSFLISLIIYPVTGKWVWGSLAGADAAGWLGNADGFIGSVSGGKIFLDFAGSTVVHSVGGWCALAGAIVLGPRIGRYTKDGKVVPIPGHNIPYVALGVFVLWLGWFGFNPGSTTSITSKIANFAQIAVNTNIAACAGACAALFASWIFFKKPDPSMTLNGVLAGLVGITAGCDGFNVIGSIATGAIAGVLVVLAIPMWDKIGVDDPVGAVSVHGLCGVFGTLAVGFFNTTNGLFYGGGAGQLIAQLVGVAAAFAWAFPMSMIIFLSIKYTIGLRASEHEELEGLDITEHGMYGYPQGWVAQETNSSGAGGAMAHGAAMAKPATVN